MWMQCKMTVVHTEPNPVPTRKSEAVKTKSPTMIVFDISAMDRATVTTVKSALRQKAEEMIQTVDVPYSDLDELSPQSQDVLKSLQSTDVTIEIGKPALACDSYVISHSCSLKTS